jgi:ankyrin repeat protein
MTGKTLVEVWQSQLVFIACLQGLSSRAPSMQEAPWKAVKLLLGTHGDVSCNPLTCIITPRIKVDGSNQANYDEQAALAARSYVHVLEKPMLLSLVGGTILHVAAASGNIAVVNQLIKMGPAELINKQSHDGSTAVALAARCGHGQVVKALVVACCITSKANAMGRTLLHEALLSDSGEAYQVIAGKGTLTEQQTRAEDKQGWSYCHFLAQAPRIAAMPSSQSTLLRHKALVLKRTSAGELPIHLAARAGHISLVECFLEHMKAAFSSEEPSAEAGLDSMTLITGRGQTVLHCAVESNSGALVDLLLQRGADPLAQDVSDGTAFHIAATKSSSENLAGTAIQVKRPPHPEAKSAMASLAQHIDTLPFKQRTHIAQVLARTLDATGCTAVQLAVKSGNRNAVICLASLVNPKVSAVKALVACVSAEAPTIALTTYQSGYGELARMLLQHGASASATLNGANIIHAACKNADHQFVNYALHCVLWAEKGILPPYPSTAAVAPQQTFSKAVSDVLAQRDAAGWQPLHCAVHSGSWLTVHCLLSCWGMQAIDAPVTEVGRRGETDCTVQQSGLCAGSPGKLLPGQLQLRTSPINCLQAPKNELRAPPVPTSAGCKEEPKKRWQICAGAGCVGASAGALKAVHGFPFGSGLAQATDSPVKEGSLSPGHRQLQAAVNPFLRRATQLSTGSIGKATHSSDDHGRGFIDPLQLAGYLGNVKAAWLLLATFYDSYVHGPFGRNLLHYIALGPLQGAEPWLFSTAPRDSRRWLPPSAILASSSCQTEQQLAYLPYTQLGELALALQVPIEADELGAYPHHYAAGSGNAALLALLHKCVDKDIFTSLDKNGRNVVHYMLAGGAEGMLEPLKAILKAYPDLADEQDSEGRLPLHYAAQVCLPPYFALFSCGNLSESVGATASHWSPLVLPSVLRTAQVRSVVFLELCWKRFGVLKRAKRFGSSRVGSDLTCCQTLKPCLKSCFTIPDTRCTNVSSLR